VVLLALLALLAVVAVLVPTRLSTQRPARAAKRE
jgi:hypothetical protein